MAEQPAARSKIRNRAVVGTGTPPVIAPGHTFGSVTDKISAIVLDAQDAARLVARLRDRVRAR